MKLIRCIAIYCCCVIFLPSVYAQSNLDESIDCTDIHIDYSNDPTLTRQERIQRMDEAFYKSLNQFEYCQTKKNAAATSASGVDANGELDSSGLSSGEAGAGDSTQGSIASSTMSGTESPNTNTGVEDVEIADPDSNITLHSNKEADTINAAQNTAASGKRPDDIPPSDNDDALAAQIRYAAEKETDPTKKAQLWNEYRKYKGLPVRE